MQIINLAGSYAYLAVAVDQTNSENQGRQMKLSNIMSDLNSRLSFVQSEIIEASEDVINEAIEQSEENRGYLKDIIETKKHALHPEAERVLSALSGTLNSPYNIYNRAKLRYEFWNIYCRRKGIPFELCTI